jgi:flagellar biosynthesis protein FliR
MQELIQPFVTKLLLVGVRVGMVIFFMPFFGSGGVFRRFKAGMTVALSAMLYSAYTPSSTDVANIQWIPVLLSETVIGLALAMSVQFVFEAIQVAGQVCGIQLGYSLESLIDPQTEASTPIVSAFFYTVAILICLQLNVHQWILRALAESFTYLPPGTIITKSAVGSELARNAALMLSFGVQVAAPVTFACLLTDVGLGLVSRAAQQVPVMLVGIALKDLLGLAILLSTLVLWPGQLQTQFARAIRAGETVLRLGH